tara:strand:- start:1009 stop:1221 length:213 start_codon:yes stop_codon:yes gene_type:complete
MAYKAISKKTIKVFGRFNGRSSVELESFRYDATIPREKIIAETETEWKSRMGPGWSVWAGKRADDPNKID